jgi:hypothetical protein
MAEKEQRSQEDPGVLQARERREAQSRQSEAVLAVDPRHPVVHRLQAQFGNVAVADALSGVGLGGMDTVITAEWAMGMADLGSLFDSNRATRELSAMVNSPEWAEASETVVSRHAAGTGPVHAHKAMELIRRSQGHSLPEAIAARLSTVLGVDLSQARVHTDSAAAQAAKSVGAHAFATGDHVYFGEGKYQPGTAEGDELLLHELTHVKQHQEGRLPTATQGEGLQVSDPSDAHEREAESVAAEAVEALHTEGEVAAPGADMAEGGADLGESGGVAQEAAMLSTSGPVSRAEDATSESDSSEEVCESPIDSFRGFLEEGDEAGAVGILEQDRNPPDFQEFITALEEGRPLEDATRQNVLDQWIGVGEDQSYDMEVPILEAIFKARFGVNIGSSGDEEAAAWMLDEAGNSTEGSFGPEGIKVIYRACSKIPLDQLKDHLTHVMCTSSNAVDENGKANVKGSAQYSYFEMSYDEAQTEALELGPGFTEPGDRLQGTNVVEATVVHEFAHLLDKGCPIGGTISESPEFLALHGWKKHPVGDGTALVAELSAAIKDRGVELTDEEKEVELAVAASIVVNQEYMTAALVAQLGADIRPGEDGREEDGVDAVSGNTLFVALMDSNLLKHCHFYGGNPDANFQWESEPVPYLTDRQYHLGYNTGPWWSYPTGARQSKQSIYTFRSPSEDFAELYALYHCTQPKGRGTFRGTSVALTDEEIGFLVRNGLHKAKE